VVLSHEHRTKSKVVTSGTELCMTSIP